MRLTETPWFRWLLAGLFVVAIFSLPWALGHPPQEQTYYESQHRTENVEAPISADERIADYTAALAVFTLVLAVVSALQVWLLMRADKSSNRMFELSGRQADLAERQFDLIRAQHIAEHRPLFRIRHISLTGGIQKPWAFTQNDLISGELILVNAGGSKATIESSSYKIVLSNDGMPAESPLDEMADELIVADTEFAVGESCEIAISGVVNISKIPVTTVFLTDYDVGNWVVYVFGQIRYADETGNSRFMGFCRKWTGKGPFIAVNDPDYEYQD